MVAASHLLRFESAWVQAEFADGFPGSLLSVISDTEPRANSLASSEESSTPKPRRNTSVRFNRGQQGSLETALAMHEHGGVLGQAAEDVRLDLVFLQF